LSELPDYRPPEVEMQRIKKYAEICDKVLTVISEEELKFFQDFLQDDVRHVQKVIEFSDEQKRKENSAN